MAKCKKWLTKHKKITVVCCIALLLLLAGSMTAFAEGDLDINLNGDSVDTLEILGMLTVLALVPSILIMCTCFTRIVIVLSFLKNAMGLQQTPPNQVMIGIALFLSLFIMSPVISQINEEAYIPYQEEQITQDEFFEKAAYPLKEFMLKQTKTDDLNTFVALSKVENVEDIMDLPLTTIIPAFITSELKRAFLIGFLLYLPFLVIDMIVSSTLMSMGMIMLPPATISLPFKILLFILVDGWSLLFKALAASFNF